MVVSAGKLEANRRNAQKSTGPRSKEGKARSPYNALTHGMTAQSAVLPGEDAAGFVDRLRNLLDDLQPRNPLEAQAIERIARDAWLSDRAGEEEAFLPNEANSDLEVEPDIWDEEAFFRNEANSESGWPLDGSGWPLDESGWPLDEPSPPAVRKAPAPSATGVPTKPGAGSPRAP